MPRLIVTYPLILLFSLVTFHAFTQVNVTKYATSDLFEVKPLINQDNVELIKTEEEQTHSQFEEEVSIGMKFWETGDLDEAIYHFEQMSDEYEMYIFDYYLGLIQYQNENNEAAVSHFEAALEKEPLFLESKYMLGILAVESKENKTARNYFKELTKIPLYESYGEHGLGLISLNEGQPYVSLAHFKKCLDADSSFSEVYIPLFTIYFYLNNYKKAREVIEKGIQIYPKWEQGIMVRAMLSVIQEQNTDQFTKDLDYLIELDPNNYHYHSIKGYLEYEYKNYSEAVKIFHKAYSIGVDSLRQGEFKFNSKFKREESIQRSLNYYMENPAMDVEMRNYLNRGICEFVQDEKKTAIQYLDSAIAIGDNPVVYTFAGSVYRSMYGSNKKAIDMYTRAIELDSTNWIAFSYRGEERLKNDETPEAYHDFSKVIELRPKSKEGYKNRGNILLKNGFYLESYKDYSFAMGIDNTDTDLYYNRAISSISMEKYFNAEIDISKILDNNPDDGEAYYLKYQVKLGLGDTLAAIISLDSASKFEKYKNEYHQELLDMGKRYNMIAQCESAYDRLVKYNSWKHVYRLERGKFLFENGKYDAAILDLKKYVKRVKDSGEGNYYLSQVYFKLEDASNGEKYLKRAQRHGYSKS